MMTIMNRRLRQHLAQWLGQWPATADVTVVGSARRDTPGWDGVIHPLVGVGTPQGTVLSVPPAAVHGVRELVAGRPDRAALHAGLPAAMGLPGATAYRGVFRFSTEPANLPDAGRWLPASDPSVPDWLTVFGHEVLITTDDDGNYLAGVGVKYHDPYGHEIAVGTEPAARGQGLARRLVAQAARRILDESAIPTYQHAFDNHASAHVADAAGFPDRGWFSYGVA
jgi:GNAT superfamily N-acetyltransferase